MKINYNYIYIIIIISCHSRLYPSDICLIKVLATKAVSYTHLDVYKRQGEDCNYLCDRLSNLYNPLMTTEWYSGKEIALLPLIFIYWGKATAFLS